MSCLSVLVIEYSLTLDKARKLWYTLEVEHVFLLHAV